MCKEFKEAFEDEDLLLTAAVGMGIDTIDKGYEIAEFSQYVDFINLMAYDLHGAWENFVGHNAPLYSRSDEVDKQAELNVNTAVQYWIENGAPPEKLMLGLGLYGRAFKLENNDVYLPGSNSTEKPAGKMGRFTREPGFLSYYEICEKIIKKKWIVEWDHEAQVPYAHKDDQWVGYDDEKSLEMKVLYAKEMGLGGIMFWVFFYNFHLVYLSVF